MRFPNLLGPALVPFCVRERFRSVALQGGRVVGAICAEDSLANVVVREGAVALDAVANPLVGRFSLVIFVPRCGKSPNFFGDSLGNSRGADMIRAGEPVSYAVLATSFSAKPDAPLPGSDSDGST